MVLLFPFRYHGFQPERKELAHLYTEDVTNFFSTLSKGLDNLEKAVSSDGLSFSFLGMAIDLLRSTHSGALLVTEKLRLPASCKGEEWLNEYMDETVKLLDVCNVLKVGVSGLEHYQNLVDVAVRGLEAAIMFRHQGPRAMHALNACKQEMARIENEHKILMEHKIESEGRLTVNNLGDKHVENKFVKWNGFWGVLFAMKITSSYICRLLLSAIVYAGPNPSLNFETVAVRVPWTNSLVRLQQRVNDEVSKTRNVRKCTTMLSHEMEFVETTLAEVRSHIPTSLRGPTLPLPNTEGLEKIRQRVSALKQLLQKFQTGVEAIDWHVNDLFDEIVEGRNKLLNIVNSSSR
ncbi:hypothetical protein MPTK1_1g03570 [Marchantia polymorpha subsp. ruderalis]